MGRLAVLAVVATTCLRARETTLAFVIPNPSSSSRAASHRRTTTTTTHAKTQSHSLLLSSRGRRGPELVVTLASAAADGASENDDAGNRKQSGQKNVPKTEVLDEGSIRGGGFAGTMYKFVRPHTIRGTILASVAGVAKALSDCGGVSSLWRWELAARAFYGLVALLCGNAFIVGINQIYDVDLDRVNKPFLPIASGELSPATAWILLTMCGITGLTLCWQHFSPLIFGLYCLGTSIGTMYSVPPFSLKKRGPLYAGLSIAVCRGFLLNFGVYYATLNALNVPFKWNPGVAFMARFMTVFAAVIAVTKDLPDVEGDKKYDVETFATRLGAPKVAALAAFALFCNYVSAILQGALAPKGAFHRVPMVLGHAALGAMLAFNYDKFAARVQNNVDDVTNALKTFYKQIWDLFYLEYVLYIFI